MTQHTGTVREHLSSTIWGERVPLLRTFARGDTDPRTRRVTRRKPLHVPARGLVGIEASHGRPHELDGLTGSGAPEGSQGLLEPLHCRAVHPQQEVGFFAHARHVVEAADVHSHESHTVAPPLEILRGDVLVVLQRLGTREHAPHREFHAITPRRAGVGCRDGQRGANA